MSQIRKNVFAKHIGVISVPGGNGSHLLILTTLQAEIRRIEIQDLLGQIVLETPSSKQPEQNGLKV
jgi:hypothetical protein